MFAIDKNFTQYLYMKAMFASHKSGEKCNRYIGSLIFHMRKTTSAEITVVYLIVGLVVFL